MKTTETWAPQECAGKGQLRAILGEQDKFFQIRKQLFDYAKFFQERTCDSEDDGVNATELLQCGRHVGFVRGSKVVGSWRPSILYGDRKGRPAI